MDNKNHWYDGKFYDLFIAPNQDKAFKELRKIVKIDSSLIDVGCGTGRLSFQLSDVCKVVDGLDLSKRNINLAKSHLLLNPRRNISFFHSDVNSFFKNNFRKYNYSVLSYVIHEINEPDRVNLLKSLSLHSDKIIIIDYLVPRPSGFMNRINGIVEFLAGREHFNNFKSYVFNQGIYGLAKLSNLTITKEIKNSPFTSHLVVLEKK